MTGSTPATTAPRRRTAAIIATLTTGVLAVGLGVAVSNPANAATIDTSASYILVNRHSGKVADVANRATADGAPLVQWTRSDAAWQQWQFVDSGGGYYRLRSRHSGKVIDVSGRSTANGANVVQWGDVNGTNQQFSVVDTAGGFVKLINRNSGKALEVWEVSTADGARLSQYTDFGGNHQQWQLVRVGSVQPPTGSPPPTGPGTPPASYPQPAAVAGDVGVHDPEVTKTPAGTYLLAHTGNNISLKTSSDRVTWRNAGSVFPGGAPWAHPFTDGSNHLWAPDISYVNGRYYLYYSASTFGSRNSAIFLATSPTGAAGSWTNQGLIISTTNASNYNAIDPNLVIDQAGQWWLSFGSFWTGIKMIRLDPATGLRTGNELHSLASFGNGIEAPTIVRRGGFYYLFVSFDRCCQGAASTYRIMVGRSTSVTGPYVDRAGRAMTAGGGTQVLAGHGSIHGPGHQAVLEDTDGHVLFYHWYASNNSSRLGINRLGWDAAGWPFAY